MTSTATPGPFIDDFEDGDLVSLNSSTLWGDYVDSGGGSSITVTNAAPGANASARSLNATGTLINNEVSGAGFAGWPEFGTGVITTDELENLPAATYSSVRFYIKADFANFALWGYRNVSLKIYMDDGDVYTRLICPYISSGWNFLEFDMSLFAPQQIPPNPNPAHTWATEAGGGANIIGWSIFVSSYEAGAGSVLETFDISVDELEFLTGPIAPTPLVGTNWVDDVEDGDIVNMHCNFPGSYIDVGGLTTFSSLATVADGGNGTTMSLEASGTLDYAGATAFSVVYSALQQLSVSATTYKNLEFYIKAVFPPPAVLFYADISVTIYMDDGDQWAITYLTQCFAGGVNGATWTQVNIDLTDTVTMAPDGAACITLSVDGGNGHTSFGLETANITAISIGPWIWSALGPELWNMRMDEINVY